MHETSWSARIGPVTLFLAMMICSAEARADAVGPGPPECPDGSLADACHGADFCRPIVCTGDADCSDGKVCRPVSLCIRPKTCYGGGDGSDDTPVNDAHQACGEGDACSEGTCEQRIVCVEPEEPTSGGPTSGGTAGSDETGGTEKKTGCSCAADQDAAPGLLLGALLGLVLRRRRR